MDWTQHDQATRSLSHSVGHFPISRRQLLELTMVSAVALAGGSSPAFAQDGAATRGGTVWGAVVGPVTSLDPYTSRLSSGDSIVYRFLYNSLLEISPSSELIPVLARQWTVSDDGLTYTFAIQGGVAFHDGTPLDAEAIKFNLERYKAEGSSYASADRLRVISAIETPDATTLVLRLLAPNTPFLVNVGVVPYASPTAVETLGEDFQLQAVGSGPFKYVSWTPNSTATFERNENYWELAPDGQPFPYLDGVAIDGLPDDSVRLLNLRSGQFQLNERINPRDVASISADPNIQVFETPHATPYIVALNPNKPPFDNKTLRQALQSALDRQAIIDNISFGTGYTIPIPFPRGAWFYIEEPSPVFDPERTKSLLAEAGYPGGIDVTFSIINRPTDNQIAQIVKAQLDAMGIRTTIEVLERTTWVDLWTARNGEMGLLQGHMTPTDPDSQSGYWSDTSLSNYAGYDNPQIRELIAQANQVSDQAERLKLWQEVTALNLEDAVYTFIGAIPTITAARTNVTGLEFVSGNYWDIRKTSLEQ